MLLRKSFRAEQPQWDSDAFDNFRELFLLIVRSWGVRSAPCLLRGKRKRYDFALFLVFCHLDRACEVLTSLERSAAADYTYSAKLINWAGNAKNGDHRIGMDCHGFSQVPTHRHTSSPSLMHVEPVFSVAAWPDSGVDWRRFSAQLLQPTLLSAHNHLLAFRSSCGPLHKLWDLDHVSRVVP
jgi:hypothetical protein